MARARGAWLQIVLWIVLIAWTLFALFPIYWTFITSVKPQKAVNSPRPTFFPWIDFQPTLKPFADIFVPSQNQGYGVSGMGQVGLLMRNSFGAAFFSALFSVILGAMAAYALSRFKYRRWSNQSIAFWFVSQRMLPPIALVVPYFILFGRLDLLDRLPTLIAVYTAMNLPLVIWLLRDYFTDLPLEIEEAALVDGDSRYGAFFRIILPLALPGLVVAFLFAFIFSWNDFLFALTLTVQNAKTLPLQLAGNVTLRGPRYWDIAAQGLVVMLPPLIIALLAGRYIVRGLTLGAINK
ncbi:MAG TPA: carbohydrate ABC transporter permease [Thermomicrobiales bacterium]|nr:carbohydrate ABC transporter permease [Thermomicrobiales bacterium]